MKREVQENEHSSHIEVGCIVIRLEVEDPWFVEKIQKKYWGFLSDREPDIDLSVSFKSLVKPILGSQGLHIKTENGLFEITTPNSIMSLDLTKNQGNLATTKQNAEAAVELTLRILFAFLATRAGGFLLHSAGIEHKGSGCLFFGPSGSGKTTVARLSAEDRVLNDDLVLLRPEADGWSMYSTPFTNPDQVRPIAMSSNVAALFRLVQDKQVFLEAISHAEALAEVIAAIPVLPTEPEFAAQLLQVAADLIQAVPVYRLHFLPDKKFWNLIDNEIIVKSEDEK